MGCNWTCLGDLSIDGGKYGIAAPAVEYDPQLPAYLRISDINDDGTLNTADGKSVADPSAKNYMLKRGDIVFARTGGSTGRNYYYDERDGNFAFAGFLIKFSLDPTRVNPRFIKYYTQSKPYWNWIRSFNTGSTRGNINAKTLADMPIPLPSRPVQNAIVSICDSISEKIRLNNQLNGYLEELVDSEFAERFDSHGPKTPLKNVLSISTRSLNPRQHVGEVWEHYSIPAFDATHWPAFELADGIKSSKYVVDNNSILISKLNPSIKRVWVPACLTDKAVCSTEFIVYKPLESGHKSFYCAAINAEEFTAFLLEHVTGSTGSRQRTQPKATHNYPMPNPSRIEIESFCTFADPIYQQIQANEIESQRLRSLRDTLLPKLMSGEIDVSKVDLTQLNSHLADC